MIEESVRRGTEDAKKEMHHEVPRCLLRLRDRADVYPKLDGEGLQLWLDYELEALRWGVASDISREELAALMEDSTVEMDRDEHRETHAGDFARWGGVAGSRRSGVTARRGSLCWRGGGGRRSPPRHWRRHSRR